MYQDEFRKNVKLGWKMENIKEFSSSVVLVSYHISVYVFKIKKSTHNHINFVLKVLCRRRGRNRGDSTA